MPGPPPPPPPAGPPPPMMPVFTPPKGDPNARSALLNSIQKGSRLKKAVTNDKSAPMLGKVSNLNNSSTSSNANTFESSRSGSANGVPMALGGLFAGGMPKLKSTGRRAESPSSGSNSSSTSNQNSIPKSSTAPSSSNQKCNIQNELKKQMANDNRTRGPPPPAPVRNFNSSEPHLNRNGSTINGLSLPAPLTGTGMGACGGSPTPNISSLHRNAQSNLNLSTWSDSTGDSTDGCNVAPRPTPSHGKPNLAPRPPQTNGKPAAPPKKLLNGKTTPSSVHRAQSMRNTSSRQPTTPDNSPDSGAAPTPPPKFGTVRHMPSTTGHGGLSHARSRPSLNGRPTDPPPSVPVMPLPSVPVMPPPIGAGGNPTVPHHHRENRHQGTPPPPSRTQGGGIGGFGHVLSQLQQGNRVSGHSTQQAPNVPPPPPPHQKTYRQPPPPPTQKHPSSPSFGSSAAAPPPPPRHSSMRERPGDFESRFKFHNMSEFPRPNAFKCMPKDYRGKSGSKC